MTCDDFQSRTAEVALGIAPAAVKRACKRHLADEGGRGPCAQRLAEARRLVAQLGLALPPVRPSEAAWRQVEAMVGIAQPAEGRRARTLLAWLLPALLCVVLWYQQRQVGLLQQRLSNATAVARQRGDRMQAMWARLADGQARVLRVAVVVPGAEAVAVVDVKAHVAWLWATGLPPHQRWSVHWQQPGQTIPAGELVADAAGEAFVALTGPDGANLPRAPNDGAVEFGATALHTPWIWPEGSLVVPGLAAGNREAAR